MLVNILFKYLSLKNFLLVSHLYSIFHWNAAKCDYSSRALSLRQSAITFAVGRSLAAAKRIFNSSTGEVRPLFDTFFFKLGILNFVLRDSLVYFKINW